MDYYKDHEATVQLIASLAKNAMQYRINDPDVGVVWDKLLQDAATAIYQYEYATNESPKFRELDVFDDVVTDLFCELYSESGNWKLIENLVQKKFSDGMSGIDFLIYAKFQVVIQYIDELVPYLKTCNLRSLDIAVSSFVDCDEDLEKKMKTFFVDHPELVFVQSANKS